MDLLDMIESRRFLGGEFLVWLWYRCGTGQPRFNLPGIGEVIVGFDDQLVLESFLAESEQSRLTGGAPTESPEAKTALRAGKRISKAKLRLIHEEAEWVFGVSAADFSFSSVKVPAVLKQPDERLLERLTLLDDLSAMWNGIYRIFLRDRLSGDWAETSKHLAAWAATDA